MPFAPLRSSFRSLRFRLTAWNTAVVLLTVGLAFVFIREGLRVTLLDETDALLKEDAEEVALAVGEFYPMMQAIHQEMDRKALGHVNRGLYVQLFDEHGGLLHSTSASVDAKLPKKRSTKQTEIRTRGGHRLVLHEFHKPGLPVFTVCVGTTLAHVDEDVSRLTDLMTVAGAAILLLAPLGGFWLAGRATHPLARIIHTASRLRPSHMEERLPIRGVGDQLDQLSLTINSFLDQIGDYLARNREFVANAAHELRSPLAAIQSSVEVALNAKRSTEEYQELLGEIVDECSRLGVLVNQLLLLAENDSGRLKTERDPVRLDQIVSTSLDMFRGAAEERGLELSAGNLNPATVLGDAGRLRQVVNNLIDNSLKFTPAGGRIRVALLASADAERIVLRVSDTGEGIAAEDLPHVFDRFYRGDKSRRRDDRTCGNGLGLSICQSIVAAHEGEIRVESTVGEGSVFEVALPAAMNGRPEPADAAPTVGAA
ncbi:MAG TPA: ATP-binding protein [Pirellulales bacterium]|nr:ATP-binding protein [Pirellulales bacterium]